MPSVFLSPSTQQANPYVDGGNEEYYMNLIADEMVPYLLASGIKVVRNDPNEPLSAAIAQSNLGDFDIHFSIHSNASPESRAGMTRGADVYYYDGSKKGFELASIVADNYKAIYPDPNLVKTVPNTSFAELRSTKAPAILIETAYHDNVEDAQWIRENIENIARNLSLSITEYFGIPFVEPTM